MLSWTTISNGGLHSSAIRSDGSLWTWGYNALGPLGNNTSDNKSSPIQIGTSSWLAVSAGNSHTMGIKTDYTLWTWGYNTLYQLLS